MRKIVFTFFISYMFFTACSSEKDMATLPIYYAAGEEVVSNDLKKIGSANFFTALPVPDSIFNFMQGKSYKANCTIPRDSFHYIRCLHVDAKGRTLVGEMIVNKKISDKVLRILFQLYEQRYPIERMLIIDHYDANDERSMRDNNSSAFNFRKIANSNVVSKHGLGLAIDINPLYNPYYKVYPDGHTLIQPANATEYIDRQKAFPYKITKGDACYKAFIKEGFEWGGEWNSLKDYQHFEYPNP